MPTTRLRRLPAACSRKSPNSAKPAFAGSTATFRVRQLKSWADILQKHAIDPYQQFAYTKGKNASDIALVIDAMDLLHSGRFDGFCLVSSDSDFTRLASRLREQGADVYGFGNSENAGKLSAGLSPVHLYGKSGSPSAPRLLQNSPPKAVALQNPAAAVPILEKVVAQLSNEEGWVNLDRMGEQLPNFVSDFDVRTYGFRKLSDLVRKTGNIRDREDRNWSPDECEPGQSEALLRRMLRGERQYGRRKASGSRQRESRQPS